MNSIITSLHEIFWPHIFYHYTIFDLKKKIYITPSKNNYINFHMQDILIWQEVIILNFKEKAIFFSYYNYLVTIEFHASMYELVFMLLVFFLNRMKGSQNTCAKYTMKCCICCLWCLEKCLKYLNQNAYTVVGKNCLIFNMNKFGTLQKEKLQN